MPCRDSGLLHDTRNMGTSGNFFERLPDREGPPSALFDNSKNLASSSRGLRPDITGNNGTGKGNETGTAEFVNTCTTQRGGGILNRTGGIYSHGGMMDYTRFPISEMHLGRFPNSIESQSWKTNLCSETADPHLAMHWLRQQGQSTNL